MTELYLLRHAESAIRYEIPNKDWTLSEEGAMQAINMTPFLASLGSDFIYSSPYLRCRETVTPYAKTSSKLINIHQGLREVHISYDHIESFAEHYKKSWEDFDYVLPTGESCRAGQVRALATLEDLAKNHLGKKILLSTHGNFIALVLKGLNQDFTFRDVLSIKSPDLIKLEFHDGKLMIGQKQVLNLDIPIPAHAANLAASFSMFNSTAK